MFNCYKMQFNKGCIKRNALLMQQLLVNSLADTTVFVYMVINTKYHFCTIIDLLQLGYLGNDEYY